jgi:sulfur dioxygenase
VARNTGNNQRIGAIKIKTGNSPELTDTSRVVLIYCRTGDRSAMAAQTMQQSGYNNAWPMTGGFEAWQKA